MPVEFLAVRCVVQRMGTVIRPISAADEEAMRAIPLDRAVSLSATMTAPPNLSRFWRRLIRRIEDGTGEVGLHEKILLRTGRFHASLVRTYPDGGADTRLEPVSTAGWDAFQWRAFFDDAMPILVAEVIPTVRWPKLRAEIEAEIGGRLKDALAEGQSHG